MTPSNKETVSGMIRQARETVQAMGGGEIHTTAELKAELERMTDELKSNRSSEDRAQKLERLERSRKLVLKVMETSLHVLADAALADLEDKATPSVESSAAAPVTPETKSEPTVSAFVPPSAKTEKPSSADGGQKFPVAKYDDFKRAVDPDGKKWGITVAGMYGLYLLNRGVSLVATKEGFFGRIFKFLNGFTGGFAEKADERVAALPPKPAEASSSTSPEEVQPPTPETPPSASTPAPTAPEAKAETKKMNLMDGNAHDIAGHTFEWKSTLFSTVLTVDGKQFAIDTKTHTLAKGIQSIEKKGNGLLIRKFKKIGGDIELDEVQLKSIINQALTNTPVEKTSMFRKPYKAIDVKVDYTAVSGEAVVTRTPETLQLELEPM